MYACRIENHNNVHIDCVTIKASKLDGWIASDVTLHVRWQLKHYNTHINNDNDNNCVTW